MIDVFIIINKRSNEQMKIEKQRGFTLTELVVTIGVAGTLLSFGMPNVIKTVQSNKMTAVHNELLSSLSLARSTAISRGSFATLCKSNSSATNCDSSASWEDGWIIFEDKNNNGVVNSGEMIISVNNDLPEGVSVSFIRDRISYGAQGYARGYSGIFTFCDSRGNETRRGMVISNNGHIRVATSVSELEGCSN